MVPGECWEKRYMGANGKEGLSGREICHGVWKGAFAALGADDASQGPLVLVSVGPRADALESITVPPNAIIAPVLPQVDILRIGVNVFLTHGGQNSFMEAMSTGTPVVVCPHDTDQPVNAQKAVSLGVGLKVDRPDPVDDDQASTIAKYSESVSLALLSVQSNHQFSDASSRISERMTACKGVPQVVDLLVSAGSTKAASESS
jgi:UDP:flavonoid glycosyltransferase YjiC (YdhE family)